MKRSWKVYNLNDGLLEFEDASYQIARETSDQRIATILERSLRTHVINIIKVHAYDTGPISMMNLKNLIGNLVEVHLHAQINQGTPSYLRVELIEFFIVEYQKKML